MKVRDLFASWKATAATIAAIISLCATVLGLAFKLDARWAHAGQVEQGFCQLERGQLRQERRYVQDKILDLEVKGDRLTDFEKRRLQELRDDLRTTASSAGSNACGEEGSGFGRSIGVKPASVKQEISAEPV